MMFLKRFGNKIYCALERLQIFKAVMDHRGLAHIMVALIDQKLDGPQKDQEYERICLRVLNIIHQPIACNDDLQGQPIFAGYQEM